MTRRQRIDSAAGAVATMAAAARDLSPPVHLKIRKGDLPFWDAVIAEKPKSEWTDSDLTVAANLARAMADAERVAGYAVVGGGNVNAKKLLETIDRQSRAQDQAPPRREYGAEEAARNAWQQSPRGTEAQGTACSGRRTSRTARRADRSAASPGSLTPTPTTST